MALVLKCHLRQRINCFHFVWLFQSHVGCSVLCHNISQVRSALKQPAVRSCKAVPLGIGTSGITLERVEDHNRMCKLMYLALEISREVPLLCFLHGIDLLPPFLLPPFPYHQENPAEIPLSSNLQTRVLLCSMHWTCPSFALKSSSPRQCMGLSMWFMLWWRGQPGYSPVPGHWYSENKAEHVLILGWWGRTAKVQGRQRWLSLPGSVGTCWDLHSSTW